MTRPTEIEIEYTLQDKERVRIQKIRGFPVGYPREYNETGFFISQGTLYQNIEGSHHSPFKVLRVNGRYKRRYFDKVKKLIIQDVESRAPVDLAKAEKKKKAQVARERFNMIKEEISIPVPDTGILVEVANSLLEWNLYTVTRVKALTYEELPSIYTDCSANFNLPVVRQARGRLVTGEGVTLLEIGKSYSYGALKKALCYIELAGRHLATARAHMTEKTYPGWTKCNTITFKDGKFRKSTQSSRMSSFRNDTNFRGEMKLDLGAVAIPKVVKR